MSDIQQFTGYAPTWCLGCGNHSVGQALKAAFSQLGFNPSSIMMVFGIGCSGNANDFINAYAIHSLHGRAIPNAIGAKLANHKMPVVVLAGDGDTFGEGGNHFMHACRGNHDITVIVTDNGVYGLTTGQVAPTAFRGYVSKSTPQGVIETPINPLTLAISQGASFVGQGFAGDILGLTEIIKTGIKHRGFSLVNILQPCVTFNKVNTFDYYRKKTYKLAPNYKKDDINEAMKTAHEMTASEKFPLGVIYEVSRPTFTERLAQLKEKSLIERERFVDFDSILKDYK